ncbi:MAG: TerC family protein [Anaerolineae bacterium]|nr:TerC family protein [Anaerolineae bacterium]
MDTPLWIWIAFNIFVVCMLALDLLVFHRNAHVVKVKEALLFSAFWIALALAFNVVVWWWQGSEVALQFLTGYLIEKSLSVDNLFVFLLIFSYFAVPAKYQHRVLFWGVLGALVMRFVFIIAGAALIARFHWLIYVFGAFLIFTGLRMARKGEDEIHPEKNPVVNFVRRLLPVTPNYHGGRFFIRDMGRLMATPLLIVLVMVETTDVLFALDSIPAIFAVTTDPFIVYTSNVFAILGLRSLFFALAGVMVLFHYLKYGLAAVLTFIGAKMVLIDFVHIPIGVSLLVIAAILVISVVASLVWPQSTEKATTEEAGHPISDLEPRGTEAQ